MRREHVENTISARVEGPALRVPRMDKYIPFETYLLANEPVWVWNSDSRSIIWANAAAKALWRTSDSAALESVRLPVKSAAVKRLTDVARRANGSGQWIGPLSFPIPDGDVVFSCQLQKLELNDGQRGVIVRIHEPSAPNGVQKTAKVWARPPLAKPKREAKPTAPLREKRQPQKVSAPRPATARKPARVQAQPDKITQPAAKPTAKPRAFRAKAADLAYLAGLSHDLRNPLTAIIGFAEILKNADISALPKDKVAEYAADISRGAMFALDLANDVLDYARYGRISQPDAKPPICPATIAAECMRLVAPLVEQASLASTISLAQNLPLVKISERSFKQILLNIILNSVKFSAAGGRIGLRVALNKAGALTCTIDDTGGAANAALRVNDSVSVVGAGVGLGMAKRLLKDAGGKLHRRKRAGGGVSTKVIFPALSLAPLS